MVDVSGLGALFKGTAELANRAKRRPLNYIRWIPAQAAFLRDPSKRKLIRTGNQAQGKTTVALAEVDARCRGGHPFFSVPDPPIEFWVVCASWSQSVSIQQKFWALVDARDLVDGTRFDPKHGFGAKGPMVQYRNGSIVRFKTSKQDGLDLSGATIDGALFDEPPASSRVYTEVSKRVARRGGVILLSMTPINAPIDWLKELVEREGSPISDHHFRLVPSNLVPVIEADGSDIEQRERRPMLADDGTPMDQAWIDRFLLETPAHEIPVVAHGEWECRVVGRVFSAFRDDVHVTSAIPRSLDVEAIEVKVCVGLDHGDGAAFSQVTVLVYVDDSGRFPRIWVRDEYVSKSTSTVDMDADETVAMLRRNGLAWENVDKAHGDRIWGGRKHKLSKKSNEQVMRALARQLGIARRGMQPTIRTVKRGEGRGKGSVSHGVRFLHRAMVRPGHFHVHPRCKRLIESLRRWDWSTRTEEWKHSIDGLRYGLDPFIFQRRTFANAPSVRLYG